MLPQRYIFSSKSQHSQKDATLKDSCCCYHKGTYFQANHNNGCMSLGSTSLLLLPQRYIFSSKSQPARVYIMRVRLLLLLPQRYIFSSKSQPSIHWLTAGIGCCCYHKGTYFQANHNKFFSHLPLHLVVVATTKVHIFKQITTNYNDTCRELLLLLLPQRYIFSSKSQRIGTNEVNPPRCCCYHKGTYFQANHNLS